MKFDCEQIPLRLSRLDTSTTTVQPGANQSAHLPAEEIRDGKAST
jgi:hypothetical protein